MKKIELRAIIKEEIKAMLSEQKYVRDTMQLMRTMKANGAHANDWKHFFEDIKNVTDREGLQKGMEKWAAKPKDWTNFFAALEKTDAVKK